MNKRTARFIFAAVLAGLAFTSFTGCQSSNAQDSASTLKVGNPVGKNVEVSLPKNMEAENLEMVINPQTGEYRLSADSLRTDASGVIDSVGAANAQATAAAAEALRTIADKFPGPTP